MSDEVTAQSIVRDMMKPEPKPLTDATAGLALKAAIAQLEDAAYDVSSADDVSPLLVEAALEIKSCVPTLRYAVGRAEREMKRERLK